MTDNKNTILAIALSALVLLGWQYFFAGPQDKARQEQLQAQQQKQPNAPATSPNNQSVQPAAIGTASGPWPGQRACGRHTGGPRRRARELAARDHRHR